MCSLTSPFWSVPGPSPSSSASPTPDEPCPAPRGAVSGARALAPCPSLWRASLRRNKVSRKGARFPKHNLQIHSEEKHFN